MDDSEPTFASHLNRHRRFSDGVHGGCEQRNVQLDPSCHPGRDICILRVHGGVPGDQQNVVEREGFLDDSVASNGVGHGQSDLGAKEDARLPEPTNPGLAERAI